MQKLLVVAIVASLCIATEARRFTRCELVRELRRQGFPESQMRDWVCLVEHESGRDTSRINQNNNGSRDYGLFQINDRYWCTRSGPAGNDCNVRCSDLLLDNITIASRCARIIYNRHRFNAWYGWLNNCRRPGALPNISSC